MNFLIKLSLIAIRAKRIIPIFGRKIAIGFGLKNRRRSSRVDTLHGSLHVSASKFAIISIKKSFFKLWTWGNLINVGNDLKSN
jgi:hypothetical protein